jgi:hypothetical protein
MSSSAQIRRRLRGTRVLDSGHRRPLCPEPGIVTP